MDLSIIIGWIPACAGMTTSILKHNQVANIEIPAFAGIKK
jgi:hypothetical protein